MEIMAKARDAGSAASVPPNGGGGSGGGFAAFSKRSQALGEFERVVRERRSGALRISATSGGGAEGGLSTTLWLNEGVVVWADGGNLSERLGRVMVAHELLTWDEYAAALDSLASRQDARLGDLLSDLRMAKREQVIAALHLQVRLRAAAALSDLDATAEFRESEARSPASGEKAEFPADLSLLYVDISKRLDDSDVKKVLSPLAHQYARVIDPTLLGTAPEALRSKMRSLVDVHDIVEAQEGERAIFMGMLLADALELADAPFPGKRIEDEEPAEEEEPSGMHVSRRVDPRAESSRPPPPPAGSTEKAAERSAEPSASESLGNPDPSNIAKLKLNRVQLSVRKVPERNPWDARDGRILSEMHYVNARSLCRVGQWARATAELQKAHSKAPEEMEYAVLLAYAQWKNAQGTEATSEALGHLEALLGEALATSHAVAVVHFVAAEVAASGSNFPRALASYRRAITFEPTFVEAAQRARQLERRLASEGEPKPKPRPAKPELIVNEPEPAVEAVEKVEKAAGVSQVPTSAPSSKRTIIILVLTIAAAALWLLFKR